MYWERYCYGAHRTAADLLHDWLAKCLVKVKRDGFAGWKPPASPPTCQRLQTHGGIRDGWYCTEVNKLVAGLRPDQGNHITLEATYKLLRALQARADICACFRYWRNNLIQEVAVHLKESIGSLPVVWRPAEAILSWQHARGAKGKLKDIDEDFEDHLDGTSESGTSEPLSSKGEKNPRGFKSPKMAKLLAQTYLINTCEAFKGVNKISLSFGEAFLGREKTLTAIMSSHEREIAAWLLPKVFPPSLVIVSFH